MIALSFNGVWRVVPKVGSVLIWLIGVFFFIAAYSRVSGFLGGLFQGRTAYEALSDSLLRPLPGNFLILIVALVASFFLILQAIEYRAFTWKIFALSFCLMPFLILVIVLFNLLAWADRRGVLVFGVEYNSWLILTLVVAVFVSVGVFLGAMARRFLKYEFTFSSYVLHSAYLYVDSGILMMIAEFAVNVYFRGV